jgi:hypothetical protein
MKYFNTVFLMMLGSMFLLNIPMYSQGGQHHGGGYFNPDSLTPVTVSGTAIVDSSMTFPMYYLDEDGNGQADYHLNFGPHWYQPDSSNASRPSDGDSITIYGGMHDSTMIGIPTIVVYEINGEFWRDPFDPFWSNLGHHTHGGGHHQGGCNGFAFGWMHDTLQTVSINGTALVDTTFIFEHYFLDEDNDSIPDYFLNFGPPWYEPTSGASRPSNGDQISIVGGLLNRPTLPMIVVYEINGFVWRDTTQIGSHFGGGWIHRFMTQPQQIHTPFDPEDWMIVNPGWHHGMMMPDSLFCQMLQLYPQNIPNTSNQNLFAGYEVGMFFPNGNNGMWQGGGCGGHMNFGSTVQFQLHYNEIQLQGFNIDENTIRVKYWDNQSNNWIQVSNAVIDPVNNTVTISESQINNFIILTGEQISTISQDDDLIVNGFVLKQNYPNPFNPETTIEFILEKDAQVKLTIYNVLGEKIFTILNQRLNAGSHKAHFNGRLLPTGILFYELKVNNQKAIKRMVLSK